MRHILITGANRGIGLAIANRCLNDHTDTRVIFACRSRQKGTAAASALVEKHPEWSDRIVVLEMDTSSDESVQTAAKEYQQQYNNSHDETTTSSLYAIVNNAGIIAGGSPFDVLNVNVRGPKRVDDAFLKFLDPKLGRIVHISSGSASGFVSRVPEEKKKAYFTNKNITWEEIEGILREIEKEVDFAKGLNKTGLVADNTGTGGMVAYGLSKGLLNSYNQALSNSHPNLKINACTPGMVATDIASTFVPWWLPLPTFLIKAVMINFLNAKTPDEGTFSTMHLLFANDLKGNGRYYGSDVKRSPLDRYRSPGDPEYVSDDDEE